MKVPVSWLRDYVACDAAPETLAERLTFSGTEVEAVTPVEAAFEGVVVGEIRTVAPHPEADRLRICHVYDGRTERPVVCGAPNAAAGVKAPLATAGTRLADGTRVGSAAIRGQVSNGMLCAEDELGISDDHTGIMVLPEDTVPGTPFAELMGGPDSILDIEVTWNRPDCLSIIGIAREVAALFGAELRLPPVDFEEQGEPVEALARVSVDAAAACPRYTARVISDVTLGPGPLWMQRRLMLAGQRPINNVVDITNYVMLETGQPLHAFDYALLEDGRIVVRHARQGEALHTLDGVARPITPEMLMIADARRPVALAGIMGGAGSEIRPDTRRVLLESACFDPGTIRGTVSTLGLSTESAYRYERGVDPAGAEWCSRRAAHLLARHAGGTVAPGVADVYPGQSPPRRIRCRYERVNRVLGVAVPGERVASILETLQIPVVARDASGCTVEAPSFRRDIEIEADLIEEVARLHGLDKIPAALPQARRAPGVSNEAVYAHQACRRSLIGLGLHEIVNYSFVGAEAPSQFDAERRAEWIVLPNPVSADYALLRAMLAPQMVDTLGRNLARQVGTAALFEMGRVFRRKPGTANGETARLCVGLLGPAGRGALDRRRPVEAEEMFLWLKGCIESLGRAQHVPDLSMRPGRTAWLDASWTVEVRSGSHRIGVLGVLAESIRRERRMAEPAAVAELDLDPFVAHAFAAPELRPIPAYPGVARDMALIVDEAVAHETIDGIIRQAAPPELTRVSLFDIFRAEGIGRGRKSLAYTLYYRSAERTLTDEDANGYMARVKEALRKALNVEIRETQ
ncbi:MAG: phenylalanine--tRNA ligase subunit beta [Lentisphaerae bacterium]|nr:phenylalanine--tRNA ligase subunit beta [Lentisphaerota bacterium]